MQMTGPHPNVESSQRLLLLQISLCT